MVASLNGAVWVPVLLSPLAFSLFWAWCLLGANRRADEREQR